MPGEAQQAEVKQPEVAGPAPAENGFAVPAFGSTGTRSHEQAILKLQQTAGNRAVAGLLAGVQRAPLVPGVQQIPHRGAPIQRAPAGELLNPEARAERVRQAVSERFLGVRTIVVDDVEKIAQPLEGMTEDEGLKVRQLFEQRYGWSLRDMIANRLEIGGQRVEVLGIGPKNERRLALLLKGTVVAPTPDPIDALEKGQALGKLVGVFVEGGEEFGNQLGAVAAVSARDQKLAQEAKVAPRRRTAQAIELKGWMDKGQKDRVFALVRSLSAPEKRDERKALSDAYEAEFKEGLYIALTKRFKDRIDFERIGALWDNDMANDDRLASASKVERIKKAEGALPKLPEGMKPEHLLLGSKEYKAGQQKIRDAKADLDEHLDDMSKQPAVGEAPAPTEGDGTGAAPRTRLDAALGEGPGTAGVKHEIRQRSGVKPDDLFDPGKRPLVLAARLARKYKDGLIKASDVETTMLELRSSAEGHAVRMLRAHQGKQAKEGASENEPAPPSPELVVDAHFAQFQAEFAAKAEKPLMVVLSSLGTAEDRNRNLLLVLRQGGTDELTELYFALRSTTKDMDRARSILGDKTGPEIRTLALDYRKRFGADLGTALVGTPAEVRRIRNPTWDDRLKGLVPKDLPKARNELDEKLMLLKGAYAYEPTGSVKAQLDFVEEVATTRAFAGTAHATGALPVSDVAFDALAGQAASQADKEAVREEARHVLNRILRREITVDANRGLYARARDKQGNIDRRIVRQTREDALAAVQEIDKALLEDPPNLAVARGQVTTLYIAEQRMKHNLGIYEERTEEAFNAFVDVAVMVASTIATAGAGGIIAGAVRATAATLATKLMAKGPDYLTSDELLADLRGGVFSIAGGKLADKVLGRFVQGWAKGIIDKADELGAAAGIRAQASAGGARAVLYGTEQVISSGTSGGLEALVQGKIDPLADQFSVSNQAMSLAQAGGGKLVTGARNKVGAWQEQRAQQKARKRPAAPTPDAATTGPAQHAEPAADAAAITTSTDGSAPLPAVPGAGPVGEGVAPPSPADPSDASRAYRSERHSTPTPRIRRDISGEPTRPSRVAGDDVPIPRASKPAGDLGIGADSRLNTERGRANREEQQRRADEMPWDQAALRSSTGADANARIQAAAFDDLIDIWDRLTPQQRRGHVQDILNEQLRRDGAHPITVVPGPLDHGNALFDPNTWHVHISEHTLNAPRLDPREFARLAGAARHEARHALHFYRGIRVALARGTFNPAEPINQDALSRARRANRNRDPQDEYSKEAHDEALEIYDVAFNRERRQQRHGPDAVDPMRVLAEMDAANRALAPARDAVRDAALLINWLERSGRMNTNEYRVAARALDQAVAEFNRQQEPFREILNRYPALPMETDAWRRSFATEAAMEERFMIRSRLRDVVNARQQAVIDQLQALHRRDVQAADAADQRIRVADAMAAKIQDTLDDLAKGGKAKAVRTQPEAGAGGSPNQGGTGGQPAIAPAALGARRPTNVNVVPRPLGPAQGGQAPDSGAPKAPPAVLRYPSERNHLTGLLLGGSGPGAGELRVAKAREQRLAADAALRQAAADAAANGQDVFVAQAEPALRLAEAKLEEARAMQGVADARRDAVPELHPDHARLSMQATRAMSEVGSLEEKLGDAQRQAARARLIARGMEQAPPRYARRASSMRAKGAPRREPPVETRKAREAVMDSGPFGPFKSPHPDTRHYTLR